MKQKDCKLGETKFVNESDTGKGVFNEDLKKHPEKLQIKTNQYQCKGNLMKGDIYGVK